MVLHFILESCTRETVSPPVFYQQSKVIFPSRLLKCFSLEPSVPYLLQSALRLFEGGVYLKVGSDKELY